MKVKITTSFRDKLNHQIDFIAKDKPQAARKFKERILNKIKELATMPFKHRPSIYFENENIRDLVIEGYVVVYSVNLSEDTNEVFGFTKYEGDPFK